MRTQVIVQDRALAMGMDVDGRSVVFYVQDFETRQKVHECRVPYKAEKLLLYLGRFPGCTIRACYEAGFSGFWLARFLQRHGVDCSVVTPTDVPKEPNAVKRKNDLTDARRLANVFNMTDIHFVRIPTEQEEANRQLLRVREQVAADKRRCQNQIKSFLMQRHMRYTGKTCWSAAYIRWLKEMHLEQEYDRVSLDFKIVQYEQICAQLKAITDRLRALSETEPYRDDVTRLTAIKGVGWLTAMTWLLEIFRPEDYTDARKISAHLGLVPGEHSSGGEPRMGHITRCGPAIVRKALSEAAWRWIAGDAYAASRYQRIARGCASKKKAIVAMARFLGTIFWAMCVKKEPYEPLRWAQACSPQKVVC